MDNKLQYNQNIVLLAKEITMNCLSPSLELKSSLSNWLNINNRDGGNNLYRNCSTSDMNDVKAYLNQDASIILSKSITSTVTDYSTESTATVVSLGQHIKDILQYGLRYVENSHSSTLAQSSNIVSKISATQLSQFNDSFGTVYSTVDNLIACNTLVANKTCHSVNSSTRSAYDDIRYSINSYNANMNQRFTRYKDDISKYIDESDTLLHKTKSLFTSLQSLVGYIVRGFSEFSSPNDLCGQSVPDWCSFTLQEFSLPAPPQAPPLTFTDMPSADSLGSSQAELQSLSFLNLSLAAASITATGQHMLSEVNASLAANITQPVYQPPGYVASSGTSDTRGATSSVDTTVLNEQTKSQVSPL